MNKETLQKIKFALFSASAGIIQIGSFTLLNEFTSIPEYVSYCISVILSVIWNFTLNRELNFKSASNIKIAMLKVFAFYIVFTPATTLLEKYLVGIGWNEYLVTAINMVLNLVLEYPYDKYIVFKDTLDK